MDTNDETYDSETNEYDEDVGQVSESQTIPVYANIQTYPCPTCGRSFNSESLVG